MNDEKHGHFMQNNAMAHTAKQKQVYECGSLSFFWMSDMSKIVACLLTWFKSLTFMYSAC